MKFDRTVPVDRPPNANRQRGFYLDNVYVGAHLLREMAVSRMKLMRFGSANSEDAVTWNVFIGLLGDHDLVVPGAILELSGAELPLKRAELLLWGQSVQSDHTHGSVRDVLNMTQGKIEANPRQLSEIEVVMWAPHLHRLTFIEAKLKAGIGVCKAVSSSSGIRKATADCRMFRTEKPARDNGCSYWGIGTGGTPFLQRFPKDYVRLHLKFDLPIQGQEEKASCARLYQLMRNAIIGREMADALSTQEGAPVDFHLIAVVAKGHFDSRPYQEFASCIKNQTRIHFGVTSWQNIQDEVRQSTGQLDVADYLKGHTCL